MRSNIRFIKYYVKWFGEIFHSYIGLIKMKVSQKDSDNYLLYSIIISYHIIEKGLTMPETRLGFGINVLLDTVRLCLEYIESGHSIDNVHFINAVKVVNEYITYHKNRNYHFDDDVMEYVRRLRDKSGILDSTEQIQMLGSEYFNDRQDIVEFFKSRHSIRNYSDKTIEKRVLERCLSLAQLAPSSCNRQPIKVYAVYNKDLKSQILALHNGSRGFGELAPVLLIVCFDQYSMMGLNERNDGYINAGIYAMNLVYALKIYGIGSCILNWSVLHKKDEQLHKMVGIKSSEQICMIIACGYLPEVLKIALSPRNDVKDVLTYKD